MALQEELEKQGNWLFRHRGKLPMLALAFGILLFISTEAYTETSIFRNTSYEIYFERTCLLISLYGFVIRVYTVGYTPANTSGRNTKGQLAEELNTTGIYSLVRHPLYLGNFFMYLGIALLIGNFWFLIVFCLLYWIYYERIMFSEEQFLRRKFGNIYLEWAERTPTFIPTLSYKKFIKPQYPFSWKKVLKKEKNGLTAVFIIFASFNIIGELVERKTDFDYTILVLCAIMGALYLILKCLKKYTNVLDEYGR